MSVVVMSNHATRPGPTSGFLPSGLACTSRNVRGTVSARSAVRIVVLREFVRRHDAPAARLGPSVLHPRAAIAVLSREAVERPREHRAERGAAARPAGPNEPPHPEGVRTPCAV